MLENNLTVVGGNLSICDRGSGMMAITPSGIDYREITAEIL